MDRHARFFFEVNDNFTRRFRQTYLVIGSHIVALKETFPQGFPRANETEYLVMKYQLVFFINICLPQIFLGPFLDTLPQDILCKGNS